MIEIVCKELEHEIQAFNEFVTYCADETRRRGDDELTLQRSEWLEERRQQLHTRMRRRRKGRSSSTQIKSPFSLL